MTDQTPEARAEAVALRAALSNLVDSVEFNFDMSGRPAMTLQLEAAKALCERPPHPSPALKVAVEALEDAEETLRLVEHPAFEDPAHGPEVEALGRRIGFGALMSSASASWRKVLTQRGQGVGGEFVSGPCHVTVLSSLRRIRAALATIRAQEG